MTLVMSDSYLPGAMVLAHSLKDAGATRELVALVTLDTLSADTITELKVSRNKRHIKNGVKLTIHSRRYITSSQSTG
jgi:hypothetical protein